MPNRNLPDFPRSSRTSLPRLSQTIDVIRADLYTRLEDVQDDFAARGWLPRRLNLNKGIVRGLIELFAWGQFQLYALLQTILQQAAPYTSSGKWLDVHAQSVELQRREATKAQGEVRFYRGPKSSGNVLVRAGRIVRTLPDGTGEVYRYVTTADGVLSAEKDFVAVPAESESYGTAANASAEQICELATPVPGIARVTNTAGWLTSEGADTETDVQLAERYRLRWAANNGCTKYAYMDWALSVPGVSSVAILDQHPRGQGTVDVVVRGTAVLPTEALLQRVREAIAPNTPINDDWIVKGPEPVPVRVAGTVLYVHGDPDRIIAMATDRLRSLFADKSLYADSTPIQIGQDVTLSLLTHVVMGVSEIKSVCWLSPVADVNVPMSGMALLESVSLTAVMAEEA